MSSTWKYLFIFFAAAFFIGGAWGFASHLPGRTVVYGGEQENTAGVIQSLSDFLGGLFHKSAISIVVFGVAGNGHNGAGLTDTIVVAYFNPDKNRLSLISVPRDLWISERALIPSSTPPPPLANLTTTPPQARKSSTASCWTPLRAVPPWLPPSSTGRRLAAPSKHPACRTFPASAGFFLAAPNRVANKDPNPFTGASKNDRHS